MQPYNAKRPREWQTPESSENKRSRLSSIVSMQGTPSPMQQPIRPFVVAQGLNEIKRTREWEVFEAPQSKQSRLSGMQSIAHQQEELTLSEQSILCIASRAFNTIQELNNHNMTTTTVISTISTWVFDLFIAFYSIKNRHTPKDILVNTIERIIQESTLFFFTIEPSACSYIRPMKDIIAMSNRILHLKEQNDLISIQEALDQIHGYQVKMAPTF